MNVFVGHLKNPCVQVTLSVDVIVLLYTFSMAVPVFIITLERELPSLANCSHFLCPRLTY